MDSRSTILAAVGQNQPGFVPLPDISFLKGSGEGAVAKFTETLTNIGGKVVPVNTMADIRYYILQNIDAQAKKITTVPLLSDMMELVNRRKQVPHEMEDLDYAVIDAHFAVAENGAIWVTEDKLGVRILPFICQHLAVVVNVKDVVPTMHEAYERIAMDNYGFGTFIAGPSKTADIEQSLVLGAHGPRSMTIFLLG